MNKNVKRIFFVLTLVTLLVSVGAVCAADDTNITTATDSSVSDIAPVSDTDNNHSIVNPITTVNDNKFDTKNMEKLDKNLKTATKNVEVNNYPELSAAIDDAANDLNNNEYVITLKEGSYITSAKIYEIGNSSSNIIINANNQTLNPQRSWSDYVNYDNMCNITINNATISHETRTHTKLIVNNSILTKKFTVYDDGNLIITNSIINTTINNNGNVTISDDVIFGQNFILTGTGNIIINNSERILPYKNNYNDTYTINNVTLNGSKTNNGNLTITNSIIQSYITNVGTLKIVNSTINGSISNQGILIIDDDTQFDSNFELSGNGEIIIDEISKVYPYISVYNGNYTLKNIDLTSYKNNNGNITFINCSIGSMYNNGNITFINSTINGSLSNSATSSLTISDDTVFGSSFTLTGNCLIIINDSNKIYPYVTTFNGTHTLKNMNITKTINIYGNMSIINSTINGNLNNRGNLNIINSNMNRSISNYMNLSLKKSIISSNINNNGNLTIDDDSLFIGDCIINDQGNTSINDYNKYMYHTQHITSTYTLENITIKNYRYNYGNLTINNSNINATIYQYGNLTINNSEITKYLSNYKGNLIIINSNITDEITNSANLTLRNITINNTIANDGVLIIGDNCTFDENFAITGNGNIISNDTNKIAPYLSIYNGTFSLENKTINSQKTNYGNLTLINCEINGQLTSQGNLTLDNSTSTQRITSHGNINIINSNINARINNNHNATISNTTLNSILSNNGNLILEDEITFGNNFSLTGTGKIYTNSTKIINDLMERGINLGNNSIENKVIDYSITNNGNLTLKNCTLNSAITNNGILIIEDDCTITSSLSITGNGVLITNKTNEIIPYISKVVNGTLTIENYTFNKGWMNFDGNITLNNCTFTVDSYGHYNYGNLTLNDCNIKCYSDDCWMNNYGIISLRSNTTLKSERQISNYKEGLLIYGEIPEVLNPTEFNDSNTVENISFILPATNNGNLTLINCSLSKITNNGNLTLINCTWNNQTTTHSISGGNIIIYSSNITASGQYVEIHDCIFINGGFTGNKTVNCTYINNTKSITGHGEIINCTFINNSVSLDDRTNGPVGAALRLDNGTVINSKFINNSVISINTLTSTASGGAGIYSYNNLTVINCTFEDNSAISNSTWHSIQGGAAILAIGNLTVTGSTFKNNYVQAPHGTVTTGGWYYSIMECGMGGAIISGDLYTNLYKNTYVNITKNTFIKNNASINGSAIYLVGGNTNKQFYITNNTFQNNGQSGETIYIRNYVERIPGDGNNYLEYINATTDIRDNTYINDTFQFKSLNLTAPSKVYSGDNITITLDVELENPQFYDEDIMDKCNYTWYANGKNITNKQTQMDVEINNTNYITYVTPNISNQRTKVLAIIPTVLNDIIITPENINQYVFEGELITSANSRLTFQGDFKNLGEIYNNKNEIIFNGHNATFTNTSLVIEAHNNTIQNMNINNSDLSPYIITIIGDDNNIINNKLTQYNNNGKTAAIYNNNGNNNNISNNKITVNGPSLSITYEGGSTIANTQGILSVGGQNNQITYNNITVANSTDPEEAQFGTIESITAPQGTNNNISYNNINCTGARFNYGINTLENVKNNQITYNNITVTGYRYTDGIQVGNGANGNIIRNNNIQLTCLNTTPVDEAAISYGIIITSNGGSGADNNTVTENNITINGAVNYGMEIYTATNTLITENNITLTGVKSMGIGYAHSPNSTVTNNIITINDNTTKTLNSVTEEIQPQSVGIKIQQDSKNVQIENNTITTNDVAKTDITIDTTDANTVIKNNKLTTSTEYGDETTKTITDTTLENNTIQTTTIITIPETIVINTPVKLTATITDEFKNPVNSGTVTFTKEDQTIATATVINGTATETVTFTQEENTTITTTYTPTSTGLSTSSAEATVSIQKPVTQLNIEEINLTTGQTVTLTAKVTDQAGNNINGGKVTFKVNGKTVKDTNGKVIYAKVTNGTAQAEYTVPDNMNGKNITITAVYSGTSKYNKETTTLTTTVTKSTPTLTTESINTTTGSTITLKATITDNDKIINNGKIVFKINGKTVKDANGKVIYAKVINNTVTVEYTLPDTYKAKDYTITATFISPDYDRLTDEKILTVN